MPLPDGLDCPNNFCLGIGLRLLSLCAQDMRCNRNTRAPCQQIPGNDRCISLE